MIFDLSKKAVYSIDCIYLSITAYVSCYVAYLYNFRARGSSLGQDPPKIVFVLRWILFIRILFFFYDFLNHCHWSLKDTHKSALIQEMPHLTLHIVDPITTNNRQQNQNFHFSTSNYMYVFCFNDTHFNSNDCSI